MQITDPIADLLTRIRNASTAKHPSVEIPASNLKKAICPILVDEGYILSLIHIYSDVRQLLPGLPYTTPPKPARPDFLLVSAASIEMCIRDRRGGDGRHDAAHHGAADGPCGTAQDPQGTAGAACRRISGDRRRVLGWRTVRSHRERSCRSMK